MFFIQQYVLIKHSLHHTVNSPTLSWMAPSLAAKRDCWINIIQTWGNTIKLEVFQMDYLEKYDIICWNDSGQLWISNDGQRTRPFIKVANYSKSHQEKNMPQASPGGSKIWRCTITDAKYCIRPPVVKNVFKYFYTHCSILIVLTTCSSRCQLGTEE